MGKPACGNRLVSTLGEIGEFELIRRVASRGLTRPEGVICGAGDDCAVLEGFGDDVLLVTSDMMVEGVHFIRQGLDPVDLGHKLLAVSLSDVAAMGGEPRDATVSVAAREDEEAAYVEAVYEGLRSCARDHGVNVVGGDTTRSLGPLVLDLTLLGRSRRDQVCVRSGARPGDLVYVSGTLGDASAGLRLIQAAEAGIEEPERDYLVGRHRRPVPRVALGRMLADTGGVTAMIDVSDGVASDLRHVCDQSGVSAVLERKELPQSSSLGAFCDAAGADPHELALAGGEDYELLFTVSPDRADRVEAAAGDQAISITRIGVTETGPPGLFERDDSGARRTIESRGHDHFTQAGPGRQT